jgi:hypothetical protein
MDNNIEQTEVNVSRGERHAAVRKIKNFIENKFRTLLTISSLLFGILVMAQMGFSGLFVSEIPLLVNFISGVLYILYFAISALLLYAIIKNKYNIFALLFLNTLLAFVVGLVFGLVFS